MKRNTCFAWVLAFLLVLTPLCALSADAELAEAWDNAAGDANMQGRLDGEPADQAGLAERTDYAADGKSAQELLDGKLADQVGLAEAWAYASGGKSAQEWLDTELDVQAGGAADNFALCLLRSDMELDFSAYAEAVAAKLEAGISNANTRMRAALCWMACGEDIPADIVDGGAGKLGVMSWVWALHLLNNGAPTEQFTAEAVAGKLLELQLEDGGWRVSGDAGDVDVTCMVLQALSYCEPRSEALNSAIERALNFLSERQRDSGGFASMGEENAESAAQVLIAISGLSIAPDDARFVKNEHTALDAMLTYQLPTGGFEHLSGTGESPVATAQALQALIALDMPGEAFYDFAGAKAAEASLEDGAQVGQQPEHGGDSDAADGDPNAQGIVSGAQGGASAEDSVAKPQEAPDASEADFEHSGDASPRDSEGADAQGSLALSPKTSIAASQESQDSAEAGSERSGYASSHGNDSANAQSGDSIGESNAASQESQDSAEADSEHSGDASSRDDESANAQSGNSIGESIATQQGAQDSSEVAPEHSGDASTSGDEGSNAQDNLSLSPEASNAASQESQDSVEAGSEHSGDASSRGDESANAQSGDSIGESIAAPQGAQDSAEAAPKHPGDTSSSDSENADAQGSDSTEDVVAEPQEAQVSDEAAPEHPGDTSSSDSENADAQGGASIEEVVAEPQEAQVSDEAAPEHPGEASSRGSENADAQSNASTEESVAAPREALDESEAGSEHSGDISSNSDSDAGAAVPLPDARQAILLAVSSPRLPVWKLCAFSAIGALALAGVIFALTRKRARGKHLLAVLLIAAVAAGAVWFVRVDSAADYYDPNALSSANADGSVTLSIRCDSVAGRADDGSTPADGAILPPTQIPFAEGDSVFDALTTAARANSIQLEYEGAEAMAYVTGINYLYEFDYGELSGWQYSVNGERVSLSCGSCALHDGDEILWEYTTDLGGGLR